MCNCGKKRSEYSQNHTSNANTQRKTAVQEAAGYSSFEYTGKSALTIIGNVTGTKYRFTSPGNTQKVNHLDAAGMMAVPVLRKIR
jgi:hypothetical protein